MKQPDLFPVPTRTTFAVRAMALSDPQWQSIEPKRELVFPVGEPKGNDERLWRFEATDLEGVAADFATRSEPAPVLYRHGDDPARGGMAAGWIDRVELGEDGLYAYIRYTERALAEIKDGAWAYRSPGFDAEQDEEGYWHPRRLSEVSLVNDPAIAGMPPIQAKAQPAPQPSADPEPVAVEAAPSETPADEAEPVKGDTRMDPLKALAAVRKALGLEDTAGPNEIMAAFGNLMNAAPAPEKEEPEMPEAEKAEEPPKAEEPLPAAASVKPAVPAITLDAEAEKVEREKVATAAAERVAAAIKAGRVTPATQEAAVRLALASPDDFDAVFSATPAPPAGRLINASRADRKPALSWAERETAIHKHAAAHGIPLSEARRQMEG